MYVYSLLILFVDFLILLEQLDKYKYIYLFIIFLIL